MNQSINTDSKNSKEPQQKYRLGTVSIKNTGGLKPVLRAPNLALSFYHGSKHTVVRSAWRFSNSSMGCQSQQVCKSCYKCQHCKTSWCGRPTHHPNYVVAHPVCLHCIDKPLNPKSVCRKCGTRCENCDNTGLWDNEDDGSCPDKCGFREVIFEDADTAENSGE